MSSPSPWMGSTYRHIRAGLNRDVLDFRLAGTFARNRWNEPDEPTLYLAGDMGVVIAEWGRQFLGPFTEHAGSQTIERDVYRLQVRLDSVIDLRDAETASRFGVTDLPAQYAERLFARSIASLVRSSTNAQALFVPSAAFLDELARWNLVIFLDKVPSQTLSWIQRIEWSVIGMLAGSAQPNYCHAERSRSISNSMTHKHRRQLAMSAEMLRHEGCVLGSA